MKRRDILNKGMIRRAAMMLLLMLLTTASAWAFKTETPTLYTISGSSNGFRISGNGSQTDSWIATNATWAANDSHKLANGITIKPNANLRYQYGNLQTLNSITFTFTAPSTGNIAIASVTFKDNSNHDISATHSDPGTTYTVTLPGNTQFTGFVVSYGAIRGQNGNVTWKLTKGGSGNYTELIVYGNGDMKNYGCTTVDGLLRTNAPWGWDITSLKIGRNITCIGDYAFAGCQQLSSISPSDLVVSFTSIGAHAFDHCDGLTEFTANSYVTNIGEGAFKNCVNLKRFNITNIGTPITLGASAFDGCHQDLAIAIVGDYIKKELDIAAQYQSDPNWSSYASKICAEYGGQIFHVTNEGGTWALAITNADDLRNLSSAVNNGAGTATNFRQTADITLQDGEEFIPIGNSENNNFRDNYDGGGHVISGLYIRETYDYSGLFGYASVNTIKNVILMSPYVRGSENLGFLTAMLDRGSAYNCYVYDGHGNIKANPIQSQENAYVSNVVKAYKVTLGSGITSVSPTASDITNGFVYNNENYYRSNITLVLASDQAPTGQHVVYRANGTALKDNTYKVKKDVTLDTDIAYNTYYVNFFVNGGKGDFHKQTFTYGTAQNLRANSYTREGYNFAGWNTQEDGNGTSYADQQSVINLTARHGASVDLHAQWTIDETSYYFGSGNDGSTEHPYVISTTDGWNYFCECLEDNETWNHFTGKTVKLAGDISVTRMAGSSSSPFTGTFDGQGKTLTVSYENTGNNTMTAPFSYVDGATIQNLVVDGSITGSAYRAAGLIGETGTTTSYITNCVSKLSISGDRYTGGFSIGGNVEIEGCVFCGTINGSSRSGGFVGYSNSALKITNSLFAPQSGSSISGGTFYYNGDAGTLANSYYTTALGDAQGTKAYTLTTAPANLGSAVTGVSYTVLTAYGNGILFGGKYYVAPEAVTIADNAMNDLTGVNGYVADVTLQSRTLYRDGTWNTLCLPFAVSNFTGTPLEGATVKELLTTSNLDNGMLTLNFSSSNVTAIEAGKPYIVKWASGSNIVSPVFTDVTIDGTYRDVIFAGGTFKGNYSPLEITDANRDDIVLLAAGNKLGYAKTDRTLGACHAYFEIPGSAQARRFVLNVGDGETTGLRPLSGSPEGEGFDGVWHDLQGRRIGNGQKPSAKGMYIVNGKVAVVK